jgi:two-component system cell cycle response regulator DivK
MAKVLIVEDDQVMSRMYARVFAYEGLVVETAEDGLKGLEKAKTVNPDIILLDIMMPNMSGLQVLDALKADAKTQAIPVIVFTNLAGRQDLDQVLAKGAIAAVNKTELTPKQLVQMVKDELGRRN